jgi:hypothetical protein
MAKPSKIVVQNLETSFYYKVKDVWTANLNHAREFENTQQAHQFCSERKLDIQRFRVLKKTPDTTPPPLPKKFAWNGRRLA